MTSDAGALLRSEARALGELAALRRDPVFAGLGVPRGDGRLVLVLPGLFGSDLYLQPLRGWLSRLGYRPVRSSLVVNAGCPNRLRGEIEAELQRRLARQPGPIALIGHSRGGMLAWATATSLQERASHLALLGSPAAAVVAMFRHDDTLQVPAGIAAGTVVDAGQRALRWLDPDCTVPACGCPYVQELRRPLSPSTRLLSIASRDDAIVNPAAAVVPGAQNIEVSGTHSGLVYNAAVYRELAHFLAAAP